MNCYACKKEMNVITMLTPYGCACVSSECSRRGIIVWDYDKERKDKEGKSGG